MNKSPVCKHLRTKSMYIPALTRREDTQPDYVAGHSSHCWCNCTLTETGPDDRPVGAEHCTDTRHCFEE